MKKLLFLSLFVLSSIKLFAQADETQYFTFPLTDGDIVYEKVFEVKDKDRLDIYSRATKWYFNTFKGKNSRIENDDPSIGQLVATAERDLDTDKDYYLNFRLQIDCKDNKYRFRASNIRHTMHGKEESLFLATYLVNIPLQTDNDIVMGKKKGYGKKQKAATEKLMLQIDNQMKAYMESLDKAINVKAEEF